MNIKVILASKSPRRRELLSRICSEFDVMSRETDENLPDGTPPRQGVELLAVRKGAALGEREELIISSDTLVELDGVPLGKPETAEDAYAMLRSLSAQTHRVHTGVCIRYAGRVISDAETAEVTFRYMTDTEIWDYVATGEPMDKAGAYGIQGIGGKFVEEYKGNFDTIMGLPVGLTARLMNEAVGEELFRYEGE